MRSDDTQRLIRSLRDEVEWLRAERIELLAHLRFATDQANRETIEAAELSRQLERRSRPEDTLVDPVFPILD
jgi:hypothetical protein